MTTPNKDDMLRKVRGLLAKAEDPGTTEHEAEALTAKASELMAKYGIDEAMAAERNSRHQVPGNKIVVVDGPYTTPKASLLGVVAKAFRCDAVQLIGQDRTRLKVHLFGFESDMEMVQLLYTSLLLQATHGAVRVEKQTDYYGRSRTRSARSSYYLGFAYAVKQRLAESTAKAEADTCAPGTALVLRSRQVAVKNAMSAEYPSLVQRSVRAGNSSGYSRGRADGQRANLHNRPSAGAGASGALR